MKRLLFVVVVLFATMISATAQVKIQSPHPDLNIKITRCAYASGTVVIDMVITNFGADEKIDFTSHSGYAMNFVVAYDDEGNSYNAANSKIIFGFPNKGLRSSVAEIFPQDIPIKFRFQFTNISANASKFSLVKIAMRSKGAMALEDEKPLQIRNLEWVK